MPYTFMLAKEFKPGMKLPKELPGDKVLWDAPFRKI